MNQSQDNPIIMTASGAVAYANQASQSAREAAEICRRAAGTKKQEMLGLYLVSEKFDAMAEGWNLIAQRVPSSQSYIAIQSGAQAVVGLTQYIEPLAVWKVTDPRIETVIVSGDSVGAATFSVISLVVPDPPQRIVRILSSQADKQREFVKERLPQEISPTFVSAWEFLATDYTDPGRGAAFLMREVVRKTLDHYAPEQAIKSCGWFTPDEDSKSGITRAHRIRHIVERFFSERPYMKDTLKALEDSYGNLSEAHKLGPLEKAKVESYIYQATKTLYDLLLAIGESAV